jgi:hypothetical protein
MVAFRVTSKWIVSLFFGCGCGLIFGAGLNFSWWLAGIFMGALVGFTVKMKDITEDRQWVAPLWVGVGVGTIAFFILLHAVANSFR